MRSTYAIAAELPGIVVSFAAGAPIGEIAASRSSPVRSASVPPPPRRTTSSVTVASIGKPLTSCSSYSMWTRLSIPRYQRGGASTRWITGV